FRRARTRAISREAPDSARLRARSGNAKSPRQGAGRGSSPSEGALEESLPPGLSTCKRWDRRRPHSRGRRTASLLAKDLPEGQAANLERGEHGCDQAAGERGAAEAEEEPPRDGEMVGRRVEDVLQHRDEHL